MLSIGLIDYIKVHSKICGMCKKDLAEGEEKGLLLTALWRRASKPSAIKHSDAFTAVQKLCFHPIHPPIHLKTTSNIDAKKPDFPGFFLVLGKKKDGIEMRMSRLRDHSVT